MPVQAPAPPQAPAAKGAKKTASAKASSTAVEEGDDLELCAANGTTEDDFVESLGGVREHELLYGQTSLLAAFAPMVVQICSENSAFQDELLQTVAATTLAKLMCLSSRFCEANLQLLFTILERSPLEAVRNNLVAALGDMAVLFNAVIDENIGYLYRRLGDSSLLVRKSVLMVLTHLVLNGMVCASNLMGFLLTRIFGCVRSRSRDKLPTWHDASLTRTSASPTWPRYDSL